MPKYVSYVRNINDEQARHLTSASNHYVNKWNWSTFTLNRTACKCVNLHISFLAAAKTRNAAVRFIAVAVRTSSFHDRFGSWAVRGWPVRLCSFHVTARYDSIRCSMCAVHQQFVIRNDGSVRFYKICGSFCFGSSLPWIVESRISTE